MGEPINHDEAEHLAILKQGESNLARCYLDHVKRISELEAKVERLRLFEHYANSVTEGLVEDALEKKKQTGKYPFED